MRSNVALAVTLTAFSTLLVAFTLPFWTSFAVAHFLGRDGGVQIPPGQIVVTLGLLTILPVMLGMAGRRIAQVTAARGVGLGRPIAAIGILFMALITTAFILKYLADPTILAESLLLCLVLILTAMALSYALTRLFRLPGVQAITIVIEVGSQSRDRVASLGERSRHARYRAVALRLWYPDGHHTLAVRALGTRAPAAAVIAMTGTYIRLGNDYYPDASRP